MPCNPRSVTPATPWARAGANGFVPADTPVHDEAATARHWATLLALLGRTLREGTA